MRIIVPICWALLLLPLLAAEPEVGPDWIANGRARVRIKITPVARRWKWHCDWRDAAGTWRSGVSGTLLGAGNKALNGRYREAWGVYYLFEKTVPSAVRTSIGERGPQVDLRLQREDLWLDLRIVLPGDGSFVTFECTGRSHPELRAHTRQELPLPMLRLTGDGGSTAARDQRERHTSGVFGRYLFAWRPDHDRLYALLTIAGGERKRSQWPPGGFANVYLDAPYVLWSTALSAPREDDRLREYGEALWRQAQWQLPGRLAQPKDARP
ncbi:MAG: hypothetical protein HN849_29325 [Victivallales bacterium]|jgi:hypothetical protein|nr:hypothetical protein [Victivallales bacterium]MBT7303667.1 hypothetical protein [Victivallales bacterium]